MPYCLKLGFYSGEQLTSGVFESPVHFNQPPRSEREGGDAAPIQEVQWVHHAGPSDGANLFLLCLPSTQLNARDTMVLAYRIKGSPGSLGNDEPILSQYQKAPTFVRRLC